MAEALTLAINAREIDEVPVGAVIVHEGSIIGRGFNQVESGKSVLVHAELVAIREANLRLSSWRLTGCTLYTTLEPCAMCAGALILSRIAKLVFGAHDPKAGAAGSVINLFQPGLFNHTVEIISGVLAAACNTMLSQYFQDLRSRKKLTQKFIQP